MRMNIHSRSGRKKKAVNLSIDATLLAEARKEGLNLSALLETALNQDRARRWLAENREAIEAYNEHVRTNGIWSDGLRRW